MWLLIALIAWGWRESCAFTSSYENFQCPYLTPCDIEVKLTQEIESLKERLEAVVIMENKLQQLQFDFNLHLTENEDKRTRKPLTRAAGDLMPSDEEVSYLQLAELQARVEALDKKVGHMQQKMSQMQVEYRDALTENNDITVAQVESIGKRVAKNIESQRLKIKEEIADIKEQTRDSIDSLTDKVEVRLDTVDKQMSEIREDLKSQTTQTNATLNTVQKSIVDTNEQLERYNKEVISRVKDTHLSTKLRVEQLDKMMFRSFENVISYQRDFNSSLHSLQGTVSGLEEQLNGVMKETSQQVNFAQRYAKSRIDSIIQMMGSFSHSKSQELREVNSSIQHTLGQMQIQMDDLAIDVEFLKNITSPINEASANLSTLLSDDNGSGSEEGLLWHWNEIQGDAPVSQANCTDADSGCVQNDLEEIDKPETQDNQTCFKPVKDWVESLIYELNQTKMNELAVLQLEVSANISVLKNEIELLKKERPGPDYFIILDSLKNTSQDLPEADKMKMTNWTFKDDVVPTLPPLQPCSFPFIEDPLVVTSFEGRPIRDLGQKFPSGSEVMHRCQDIGQYKLIGDPIQQCHNGTWNGHKYLECEKLFSVGDTEPSRTPSIGWELSRRSSTNAIGATPEGNLVVQAKTQMTLYCLFPLAVGSINLSVERSDGTKVQLFGKKNGYRFEYPIRGYDFNSGVYTCESAEYGTVHSIHLLITDVHCPTLEFDDDVMEPTAPINTRMNSVVIFRCLYIDAEITWSNDTMNHSEGDSLRCLPSGVWSRDLPTCK